jgi:Sec-independent protein translocase protein TatA
VIALIGNLSATEILVVGIVAVLIFGKRLPEVASQTYSQIRKLREGMDQFRRDTGIDRELSSIQTTLTDVHRDVQKGMTIDARSTPSTGAPIAPVPYGAADAIPLPPVALQQKPPPGAPSAESAPSAPAAPPQDLAPGS